MALQNIADGVWATQTPVSFYGMPMTARTTIVELPGGGLFVLSPGALDDALGAAVDALGEVRAIVAPNRFHHLFVGDWKARYPEASVFIPEALLGKRPDLAGTELLGDEAPGVYGSVIAQQTMRGLPAIGETWFFHRPSGTLIDTDLMHNVQDAPTWLARAAWRSMGAWKKFGPSILERALVRDRRALRESVETALAWPIERIVVAHGDVLAAPDARDVMARSWGWLLR